MPSPSFHVTSLQKRERITHVQRESIANNKECRVGSKELCFLALPKFKDAKKVKQIWQFCVQMEHLDHGNQYPHAHSTSRSLH